MKKKKKKPHTKTSLVCSKVLIPVQHWKISKMWGLEWHDLKVPQFADDPTIRPFTTHNEAAPTLILIPLTGSNMPFQPAFVHTMVRLAKGTT